MGLWIISSYDDVVHVLKHSERFEPVSSYDLMFKKLNTCEQAIAIMNEIVPLSTHRMATSGEPVHSKLKDCVRKSFSYKKIQSFEKTIKRIALEKLDKFKKLDQIDLVEHYCKYISLESVLTFIGIPSKDFDYIYNVHNKIARLFFARLSNAEQIEFAVAFKSLKSYLSNLLLSFGHDEESVISELSLALQDPKSNITLEEVIQLLFDIISAGFDTTLNALNWTFYRFLEDKNIWAALDINNSEMISLYVSESLRLNMAQMGLVRVAKDDCTLNGVDIPKEALLYVLHTYANRDPLRFENPNVIDIHQKTNKQLTFGYGLHYCLGAQLAKLEVEIAVKCLKIKYPNLTLSEKGASVSSSGVIKLVKKLLVSLG